MSRMSGKAEKRKFLVTHKSRLKRQPAASVSADKSSADKSVKRAPAEKRVKITQVWIPKGIILRTNPSGPVTQQVPKN